MSNLEWAKREVELACQRENPDRKVGEFDYGCACYESALKAFESLHNDNHSGFSIGITKNILNRLIDGRVLMPINGTDDEWGLAYYESGVTTYQCNRMGSLFKDVYSDGTVKYHDNNYMYCTSINNPEITYSFGLVSNIIHDMFPITMPYFPRTPIKVFCEDFLTDKANGAFDTVGIFYALKKDDLTSERIEINKFFKEGYKGGKCQWIEISKEEYEERKAKKL